MLLLIKPRVRPLLLSPSVEKVQSGPILLSCRDRLVSESCRWAQFSDTEVLNAVLFIADPQMAVLLLSMAIESNEFAIGAIVELTRNGYAFRQMMGTTTPDVMLLEMTEIDRDLPHAATIHAQFPKIPIVGLASRDPQLYLNRNPNLDL